MRDEYFNWLVEQVRDRVHFGRRAFYKLLRYLFDTPFAFSIGMDANREEDGIELRRRFNEYYFDSCQDPCSVLEMMVALAIRIQHLMERPDSEESCSEWFWLMIKNMELDTMSDDRFYIYRVETIVHRMLNRDYAKDGRGGLFRVRDSRSDMRKTEIWYQACGYLNEII